MGNTSRASGILLFVLIVVGCGSKPPAIPETPIAYAPSGGDVYAPKPKAEPAPTVAPPPPPPPAPAVSSAPPAASASAKPAPSAKPKGK